MSFEAARTATVEVWVEHEKVWQQLADHPAADTETALAALAMVMTVRETVNTIKAMDAGQHRAAIDLRIYVHHAKVGHQLATSQLADLHYLTEHTTKEDTP